MFKRKLIDCIIGLLVWLIIMPYLLEGNVSERSSILEALVSSKFLCILNTLPK